MVNLGFTKLTLEGMVGNLAIGKDECRSEHNPLLGGDDFTGRSVSFITIRALFNVFHRKVSQFLSNEK